MTQRATSETAPILVVEDDEGDALLVRECLVESGRPEADVLWRRTLAEGLEAMAEGPSCVLLDLGLPDAQGLEALQRLVSQRSATPVIVLTGRERRTGVEAVAAGAQDYLVKDDITPELLDRTIRYAVQRRQTQLTELELREERMLAAENSRLERGLLPRPLLRTHLVTCASHYQPGRARAVLGGDFFDVVETAGGVVRAVIGDVMGHGPDEAALGVALRVAWRALVLAGVPADQVLATLSQLLEAESGGGIFVTVCEVSIAPDLEIEVRVAGHPPPLLCGSGGEVDYLDVVVGPPLGVEEDGAAAGGCSGAVAGGWSVTRLTAPPGSSLVLYTDGLLDLLRRPERADSVGLDELHETVLAAWTAAEPVPELINSITRAAPVRAADDTALVVLTVGR